MFLSRFFHDRVQDLPYKNIAAYTLWVCLPLRNAAKAGWPWSSMKIRTFTLILSMMSFCMALSAAIFPAISSLSISCGTAPLFHWHNFSLWRSLHACLCWRRVNRHDIRISLFARTVPPSACAVSTDYIPPRNWAWNTSTNSFIRPWRDRLISSAKGFGRHPIFNIPILRKLWYCVCPKMLI